MLNVPDVSVLGFLGAEFMMPTKGYYCSLCDQSFADHVAADEHIRTYAHNEKFKVGFLVSLYSGNYKNWVKECRKIVG